MLKYFIEKLYQAKNHTPQEQLKIVIDLSRRGFLKQVLSATTLGVVMGICAHKSFAAGIDGLPDLGDSDRLNLTPYEADLLGRQIVLDIYAGGSMVDDYDSLTYLNQLGNNLVSYSPMNTSSFNFYLIKDKEINAFALPGGYVCAYNGLIYTTMSEAELSSVMAHEIGHVVQHHIFRNISIQNRAQWLGLAGILAGALLAPVNPGAGLIAMQSGQSAGIQSMLSFSRDYEKEADRVGQQLMYQAGFDAHAMPEFFARMQKVYQFNTNDALAFLQTHPVTIERLSEAEARANQLKVKMRGDSIDFLLVREKCRIRQVGSSNAIKFYLSSIKDKRYVSLEAQHYGLSLAYLLNKQLSDAFANFKKITNANYLNNPIVLGLNAQILVANKDYSLAQKFYASSLSNYPNHKGLWMGELDLLINKSRSFPLAAKRLDELIINNSTDPDVWDQYAILYSDANYNNPLRYHYGLGMEYYILGNLREAASQFQTSLKVKTKTSRDNHLQDLISAKLIAIGAK